VKKIINALVIVFSSLAFTSVSFAQAKPATPTTPMERKSEIKSEKHVLTGDATSVDAKAGKLTVKAKDKEIKLTADSKSTKAALEKIKVGDTVRVYYTEKDGKIIAASAVKP
jgi:Cu/Ag efflux protein CusF